MRKKDLSKKDKQAYKTLINSLNSREQVALLLLATQPNGMAFFVRKNLTLTVLARLGLIIVSPIEAEGRTLYQAVISELLQEAIAKDNSICSMAFEKIVVIGLELGIILDENSI